MKKIQLMKISDVAKKVGVNRRTISRWMARGRIGSYFGAGAKKNLKGWVKLSEVEGLMVDIKESAVVKEEGDEEVGDICFKCKDNGCPDCDGTDKFNIKEG